MAYKTFRAHNGIQSWNNHTGTELTLYGGFYDYKTPKTFRVKKCLVLTTADSKQHPMRGSCEYLVQQVSEADLAKAVKQITEVQQDRSHRRLEVCLKGRGTNNQLAYSSVDYS